ncbi:MAG: nicotinate-nucleotide--dimethylbenzimidazole phosphoribosyltransferase [Hyphomicrobium sp.]|nr:nicotinate-nucleotide--dimethylbenzimidazole phosphoribosyltransferase [Hyphomicrobium sp.]
MLHANEVRLPGWVYQACPPPSQLHRDRAAERQAQLTKPTGALGRLETLAIDLAGLQATDRPRAERASILIFAGDHGIVAQGVSAYPQEVTVAMMANFAAGGAAISVLARELNCRLEVIDAGSLAEVPLAGVVTDKPRAGTRDFSREPALNTEDVSFAFECGGRAVERAATHVPDLLILGEMGIGNTTASAAIAAALLAVPADAITGSGTGIDADGRKRKAAIIELALALHKLRSEEAKAETVLQYVGGLEVAALVGAIIAAAQRSLPVLVDGFIVSVSALAATRINPTCRPYLIFSHRSAEEGHRRVLEELQARPLLDLDLRLGEGSGAALALAIVRLACALHNNMATFSEAAVPDRGS